VEDIAHLTQTCIRRDEQGKSYFDFDSLIPMPAILKGTAVGTLVDDALVVLGRDDLAWIPCSLEERMKRWEVPDIEAFKKKIGPETFEKAHQSIEAFEQTGVPNWYTWANMNWGTKWNASDFEVIREEPGRYECRFDTAWSPPEPVYVKLAEVFPNLCFEVNGGDDELFDFQATVRNGAFNIQYDDDLHREGFFMGMDPDHLLDYAKAYGNDRQRFLCVGLCGTIRSNHRNSKNEDPEWKAVVAWARGDTKEESENSCLEVIARKQSCIETLVTDWQFTVYAPGEIQFQEHAPPEALGVSPAISDDLPF
jgi:hypothetical protein